MIYGDCEGLARTGHGKWHLLARSLLVLRRNCQLDYINLYLELILFRFIAITLITCGSVMVFASEEASVRWYAHKASGQSSNLSDSAAAILLKGGWKCIAGETSKQLPDYEARQINCVKHDATIEFTVQCSIQKNRGHTQVRFRNKDDELSDFIEVGCEYDL